MPAPQKYPTPHEQLLGLALEARAEGLTFDEFWNRAVPPQRRGDDGQPAFDAGDFPLPSRRLPRVRDEEPPYGAVLWPNDSHDRKLAYAAILASESAWRAAYERRAQTRAEAALGRLAPLLDRMGSGGALRSAA